MLAIRLKFSVFSSNTPQRAFACGVFLVFSPARTHAFFSTFVPIMVFDRH
jgi:hypothetical protein|tara:strand:- start:1674 stop:1823 length:150 start_codon:yes stop_codon:yes gene_type:complete